MALKESKNVAKTSSVSSDWEVIDENYKDDDPSNLLCRVHLEKDLAGNGNHISSQFFVVSPNDLDGKLPDLNFIPDHFDDGHKKGRKINSDEESFVKVEEPRIPNEPESGTSGLNAENGENEMEKNWERLKSCEEKQRYKVLPSDTLIASAALLKSYLIPKGNKKDSPVHAVADNDDTVSTVVKEIWHNMKYGWTSNMKASFSKDTPIYLLGKFYHRKLTDDYLLENGDRADIESFKRDFSSITWFTYRNKFPPLPPTGHTSDCGWGCMIRSAQMMMATALRRHLLPINWHYNNRDYSEVHWKIIELFCDTPSICCPFSIHSLVGFGHRMKKQAGNWYGPSCVAYMLKEAMTRASKRFQSLNNLTIYIAQDGAVYIEDVIKLCSTVKCLCKASAKYKKEGLSAEDNINSSLDTNTDAPALNSFVQNVDDSFAFGDDLCCDIENCPSESSSYPREEQSALYADLIPQKSDSKENSLVHTLQDVYKRVSGGAFSRNKKVASDLPNTRATSLFRKELQNGVIGVASCRKNKESKDESTYLATKPLGCIQPEISLPSNDRLNVPMMDEANSGTCDLCDGWKACIIFIPVRLGGSNLNPIYQDCIFSLFMHDLCIGIIGGRPKHSLYFVGCQDESLIYLDPHLAQDYVPLINLPLEGCLSPSSLKTFHCSSPKKIHLSKVDPSATVGFYCRTRKQFQRLVKEIPVIITARDGNVVSPMFEFVEGRSQDVKGSMEDSFLAESLVDLDKNVEVDMGDEVDTSLFYIDAEDVLCD